MLISWNHYANYLAPPSNCLPPSLHLSGLLSPFFWMSSISFLLFPPFIHLSFHSWVSFNYSLLVIYFRIVRKRVKTKHSWRKATGTNLTCNFSLVCKIQWGNHTAWQSRKKDTIKNVFKQIMKLGHSHFTSFSLQFDYYCVRILTVVLLAVLSHFRNVKTLSDFLKENIFLLSIFPFYGIMEVNYWIYIQFSVLSYWIYVVCWSKSFNFYTVKCSLPSSL